MAEEVTHLAGISSAHRIRGNQIWTVVAYSYYLWVGETVIFKVQLNQNRLGMGINTFFLQYAHCIMNGDAMIDCTMNQVWNIELFVPFSFLLFNTNLVAWEA